MRSSGQLTDAHGATATRPRRRTRRDCAELLTRSADPAHDAQRRPLDAAVPERVVQPVRPVQDSDGRHAGQRHLERHDGQRELWPQTIYGDGGQSGFDSGNPSIPVQRTSSRSTADENFQNGDPTTGSIVSGPFFQLRRRRSAFYMPEIADPARPGHDLRGAPARLAHAGLRRRQGEPRGELPRVHHLRWTSPAAVTSCPLGDPSGNGGPGISGDLTLRRCTAPTARAAMSSQSAEDEVDTLDPVGRDRRGPRLRLEERERRQARWRSTNVHVHADSTTRPRRPAAGSSVRHRVDPTNANRAWIAYSGYNANDADDSAGPRVPGDLQPGDGHGDVDVHRQRHRPARRLPVTGSPATR